MLSFSGFCFRMNLVGFLKQKGAITGLETIGDEWKRQALFTSDWLCLFLGVPSLSLWDSPDRWVEEPALKLRACEEIWDLTF